MYGGKTPPPLFSRRDAAGRRLFKESLGGIFEHAGDDATGVEDAFGEGHGVDLLEVDRLAVERPEIDRADALRAIVFVGADLEPWRELDADADVTIAQRARMPGGHAIGIRA